MASLIVYPFLSTDLWSIKQLWFKSKRNFFKAAVPSTQYATAQYRRISANLSGQSQQNTFAPKGTSYLAEMDLLLTESARFVKVADKERQTKYLQLVL